MKKRVLSLVLTLVLVAALALPGLAAPKLPRDDSPIIVIAGYTATQLFDSPNDAAKRKLVWNPDFAGIGLELLREAPGLLGGIGLWGVSGYTGLATKSFKRAADRAMGYLMMTPDGKPAADVGPYPVKKAADCSYEAIQTGEDPNAIYMQQFGRFCKRFAEQIPRDRIFVFQYDWRYSNVTSAAKLRAFIKEVKKLTGSKTVRLFGSSYGGLMCGVYLADYAGDGDVSKIVMEVPALGGSSAIPHLMTGSERDFRLNLDTIVRFLLSYNYTEGNLDFEPLLRLVPEFLLAPLLSDLLEAGLLDLVKSWGSIWDLLPADQYEAVKKAVLSENESWYWQKDVDRLQREIRPNIGKILRSARTKHGIDVRIVADYGSLQLAGKTGSNSDGLLDLRYTTGARVFRLGERGVSQSGLVCKNQAHRHVSPGQDVDASAAWLPDNTWFVQGQFHGASYLDPYATELEVALVLDPKLDTVFDNPAFPQFGLCRQACADLCAKFDKSPYGFVGKKDNALALTNLTEGCKLRVISVESPNSGLNFTVEPRGELKPGESLRVAFTGTLAAGGTYTPLTVSYWLLPEGGLPAKKTKTFDVTIDN